MKFDCLNLFQLFLSHFASIDDVLADSDSDLENDIMLDNDGKGEQRKRKTGDKDQKYIHEDPESIVDLMDINAMSKISCTCHFHGKFEEKVAKFTFF